MAVGRNLQDTRAPPSQGRPGLHIGSFHNEECQVPPSSPEFCAHSETEKQAVLQRLGDLPSTRAAALSRVPVANFIIEKLRVHIEH